MGTKGREGVGKGRVAGVWITRSNSNSSNNSFKYLLIIFAGVGNNSNSSNSSFKYFFIIFPGVDNDSSSF